MSAVVFVVYQTGASSNGGLSSISELIERAPFRTVQVITNRRSDFASRWEERGIVEYWRMSEGGYNEQPRRLTRAFSRIANNFRIFRLMRRSEARIVHINDVHALWNAAFGAKIAGAKVIFNVRDAMRIGASVRKWRFHLKLCDCFLVLSREMQADWHERLSPLAPSDARKIRHLYSIVDRTRFSPAQDRLEARSRLGVALRGPLLLYPGRFEAKKGQLRFIGEALPEIARVHPDATVHFVGDFDPVRNTYSAACMRTAEEVGLAGNVRFSGHATAIEDWYRAADLVLLASDREGLARGMIEAIACGTPVVSSAVCSAREVLETHGAGTVVPLNDSPAFAAATLALLSDDETRAKMAGRGPCTARELFDPERVAAAYAELVAEILAPTLVPDVSTPTSGATE